MEGLAGVLPEDAALLLQVDGPEEIPDPEDPSKFTSVGVQVEDHRG